jgi:hypothetical protein
LIETTYPSKNDLTFEKKQASSSEQGRFIVWHLNRGNVDPGFERSNRNLHLYLGQAGETIDLHLVFSRLNPGMTGRIYWHRKLGK